MATLFLMVGISGSGKSFYANKLSEILDGVVISSDEKRKEWFGDETDQTHNKELFARLHNETKTLLSEGKNVIFDATNINYYTRKNFISFKKDVKNLRVVAIYVKTPFMKCLEQNNARERTVPEFVLARQRKNFEPPTTKEGFDVIFTIEA